jgi:hypothetical protein
LALPAHSDKRIHNVITNSEVPYIGTNRFNDACALVTSDPWVPAMGHIASDEVLI